MGRGYLWHTQEVDSVVHELKTDLIGGLSNKEALSRLSAYGHNEPPEHLRSPWGKNLMRQQISLMTPVLLIGAILLHLSDQLISAVAVLCIMAISILLSGLQEIKSEKCLRLLRKAVKHSMKARVLRNGHINLIKTVDIVPGDIICFETGDYIAADGRLIESKQLELDESALWGIKEPFQKDPSVLDENVQIHQMKNMVFMGSVVIAGSGKAIVTATGSQAFIAQKSLSSSSADFRSLLESETSRKGLRFAYLCAILTVLLWGAMVASGIPPFASVIAGLSFFSAAWPAGLIEAVRLSLISGIKKLNERKIVVRKLSGAESLANLTVICTGRKGIMTENKAIVRKIFVDGHIIDVNEGEANGFPQSVEDENPDLPLLFTAACMCSNTDVRNTSEGWVIDGDPTEGALIISAMKGGISKDELGLSLTKVSYFPYDHERKMVTAVLRDTDGGLFLFTKGPPKAVLSACSRIQLHGYIDNLDIGRLRAIWAVNLSFAEDSMESIAFAYRKLRDESECQEVESLERNLIFIGMMGMEDPLRIGVREAIGKCSSFAIKPILLTDDCKEEAFNFALDLGIIQNEAQILTGEEMDILGEKEFLSLLSRFSVYADISPAHKERIARCLKESGETVAMVGTDIGDLPALHLADVKISAGEGSTSIVTSSSDLILMDNSFTTAVCAIEGIRQVFLNAKKLSRFLLSGGIAGASAIIFALIISIFWRDFPFPPISFLHVLWLNLVAGIIPSFAIIFNFPSEGETSNEEYSRGDLFSGELKSSVLIRGLLAAVFTVIAFAFSFEPGDLLDQSHARTSALTILIMSQLAFTFQCCRRNKKGFFRRFFANKLLLILTSLALLLHVSAIYIPYANTILGTRPLSAIDWIPIIVAFAVFSLPLDEPFTTHVEYEEAKGVSTQVADEFQEKEEDKSAESDSAK